MSPCGETPGVLPLRSFPFLTKAALLALARGRICEGEDSGEPEAVNGLQSLSSPRFDLMLRRVPFRNDPEWQARVRHIRAAGRRGESPVHIASVSGFPTASVKKILAPAAHAQLSDPGDLLRTGQVRDGQTPADVQLYWVGFFTATGYIRGQGSALTLVVTLGENGRERIEALEAELTMGRSHCEICHSSLAGWQAYFRDPILCHALIPWGIPSDLYGEDPALLEDLPEGLFLSFIRGYIEGDKLGRRPPAPRHPAGFTIRGTPAVLGSLNTLIQRYWGITSGFITQVGDDAVLQFPLREARGAFASRLGVQGSADVMPRTGAPHA